MPAPTRPASRYQRRILGWGLGIACALFVIGAPIYLDRIESDLTERVTARLVEAGYDDFTVSFSGQTGSIECTAPLGDPQGALDLAFEVRGVHAIDDLPDECRVRVAPPEPDEVADTTDTTEPPDDEPAASSTTSTSVPAGFESVAAVVGGSPQFSLLEQLVEEAGLTDSLAVDGPLTLFAPVDAAFDDLPADALAQLRSDPALLETVLRHHLADGLLLTSDLATGPLPTLAGGELDVVAGDAVTIDGASIVDGDVLAANGVVHAIDRLLLPDGVDLTAPPSLESVVATFSDGGLLLDGVVRSEVERSILADAATSVLPAGAVDDQLTTDPDVGLDEPTAQSLARLVAVMPVHLVSGAAGFDGELLFVNGVYRTDDGRDAMQALAEEVGATARLEPRPDATEDDAVDLEAELNAFVADNPILFEPSSSVLDETALPILDEIARLAGEFGGVAITVEGHTDSDGVPIENLALSQRRAEAVRDALVERGLDPDSITAEGFGSSEPVLVDGVEDKPASRRVEFRVEVTA